MSVLIEIPSLLFPDADGLSEIRLTATTLRMVLEQLERDYPRLHCRVCNETGAVRRHVNLFVNASLVRGDEGLDAPLHPGDVVAIMPAVSGG